LGSALLEAKLWQEAVTELTSAVAADPRNSETIIRLARGYIGLKDLPAAGRTLESAVARGVDPAPVYALLASVYEQTGHFENAIPAMRLAIERDPQSERYRFNYGLLLTNASAPDAAVIRLKEALETFPRSPRLWLGLGIAYFKSSKNDEAAKALTRAIELDPKFAPPFAYLGMTYVEIGQYDQAVKTYEQALAVDPKLGVVHYLIADAMQKQNTAEANAEKIENHLFRAVELEPTFAPARLALGKLYLRNNRLSDALAQLERVIEIDSTLAEAYYQLGRAYTKLKRTTEAQTAMATFKRLSDSQKEQGLQERKEIVRRLADVVF
jgi:tetratricopeptide (TPR) repeat protein